MKNLKYTFYSEFYFRHVYKFFDDGVIIVMFLQCIIFSASNLS